MSEAAERWELFCFFFYCSLICLNHVLQVAEWGADGVIVGSAMVRILGEAKSPEEGLKELEVFTTSLKSALHWSVVELLILFSQSFGHLNIQTSALISKWILKEIFWFKLKSFDIHTPACIRFKIVFYGNSPYWAKAYSPFPNKRKNVGNSKGVKANYFWQFIWHPLLEHLKILM